MRSCRPGALVFSACLLAVAATASAQTALVPTITGNELTAKITLPGDLAADLTITFEQTVGLNADALTLTAAVVSPSDLALLSRLGGSLVSVPGAFPVLVRVEPTASSGLSFSGVYKLSVYTQNLTLAPNLPVRVFRAAAGGTFKDMTGSLQMGSVRAGGSGPGFSEFLLVLDGRPVDAVITEKLDALQAVLTANAGAIAPAVAADLNARLGNIRSLVTAGQTAAAIEAAAEFGNEVKKQSGAAIPDVWRANDSLVNVAGALRSAAETLRFGLVVKASSGP